MEKRIEIDGKLYPCYMTIGAMMAFKKITGREVDDMAGSGIEGVATLFFCCVRGACRREKIEFPFKDPEEMADFIRPEDLSTWEKSIAGEDSPVNSDKKKG